MLITYSALFFAILIEVITTSFMQVSQHFTRPISFIITITGYGIAFYFWTVALRMIPVGIGYAIWSGLGIALISAIDYFIFRQFLDIAAIVGISLIIVGVIIICLFSQMPASL